MKKRALFGVFATFCAAACLVCGCGGDADSILVLNGGTDKTEKTYLSVFGNRADKFSLSVIEDTLQGFMSENSVFATYESAPERNYWKALDKRYETDNLDDIFTIEHDRLLSMSKGGALADLSDIVSGKKFNYFAENQLYGADGKIYAVPTSVSTFGLFVNYDLQRDPPRNLSEFAEACNSFVRRGITPIICNNSTSLRSLILAKGMYETYCSADTASEIEKFNAEPVLLSAKLNEGIDFVYEMIENKWIDIEKTALNGLASGESELFKEGKQPFMISLGWTSDLLKEAGGTDFKYGIYAYPVLDEDRVLVARADLVSVKKGENEAEAKKLLSIMTGNGTLSALNEYQSRFSPLEDISGASSELIPSAPYLTKGKCVISGDCNLQVPLDGYLTECTAMILEGASANAVKAHLYDLLSGEVGR